MPINNIPAIEPIKLVAQVIQAGLSLPAAQIMLAYQNFQVPNNTGLYVALSYGPEVVIGAPNTNDVDSDGNYVEVQSVAMMHTIEIDILSFDDSARLQKEQVIMALNSYQAQQLMNQYSMRIANTPGAFMKIESLEPSKQLNRYHISIVVYALHQQSLVTPYYDKLSPINPVFNA